MSSVVTLRLMLLAFMVLSCCRVIASPIDTSNASGWIVLGTDGKMHPDELQAVSDATRHRSLLQWHIRRQSGHISVLCNPVSIADLNRIEVDIWSQRDSLCAIQLEDSDHAKFHFPITLAANRWTHVTANMDQFKINDESPIKKNKLDPTKLTTNVVLIELGSLLKAKEDNVLRIDGLHIRKQEQTKTSPVPERITTAINLTGNTVLDHPVTIEKGGSLLVSGPRVRILSPVFVRGGTLSITNSTVLAEGRFPHDLQIKVYGGQFKLKNCVWSSPYNTALDVGKGGSVVWDQLSCSSAGFTTTMSEERCTCTLRQVKNPCEFILPPGSKLVAEESEGLLFWNTFTAANPAAISFPEGAHVTDWALSKEAKIDLQLKNCKNVLWGILLASNGNLRVENSQLKAIGLLFTGKTPAVISGLKNGQATNILPLFNDRKLTLPNTNVEVWNIYPAANSNVTINGSTIGEIMAFQNAQAFINNSTCDGTGGYVKASHQSTIRMKNCTVTCPVILADQAAITMENCTVKGAVVAIGQANLTLNKSTTTSTPQRHDQAHVTVNR